MASGQIYSDRFVNHLYAHGFYRDIIVLDKTLPGSLSRSSYFTLGKAHIKLDSFRTALTVLSDSTIQLTPTLGLYKSYCRLQLGMNPFPGQKQSLEDGYPYIVEWLYGLQHKPVVKPMLYDSVAYSPDIYTISIWADKLQRLENKSAFKAGMLSAFLPGTGQWYISGKPRHFFATFGALAFFAAPAVEAYIKKGWQDVRFIAFGGITGLFYLGNIWGAAYSKKRHQHIIHDKIDHFIDNDLQRYLD